MPSDKMITATCNECGAKIDTIVVEDIAQFSADHIHGKHAPPETQDVVFVYLFHQGSGLNPRWYSFRFRNPDTQKEWEVKARALKCDKVLFKPNGGVFHVLFMKEHGKGRPQKYMDVYEPLGHEQDGRMMSVEILEELDP